MKKILYSLLFLLAGNVLFAVLPDDSATNYSAIYESSSPTLRGLAAAIDRAKSEEAAILAKNLAKQRDELLAIEDTTSLLSLAPQEKIWVTADRKTVVLPATVAIRKGLLEFFACVKGTKDHESVVTIETKPYLLHAALLVIGAEPGKPAEFDPKFVPATGDEIEVKIRWKKEDGTIAEVLAQEWIVTTSYQPMKPEPESELKTMSVPWVFTGSMIRQTDEGKNVYLADVTGEVIGVSNFPASILDVPIESTSENENLMFAPNTEAIPETGTNVTLLLTKVEPKPLPTQSTSHRADSPHDSPQWGKGYTHNNVSDETGLASQFSLGEKDTATGKMTGMSSNVRFSVSLGKASYTPPTIAGGRIFVGTNNVEFYEPERRGDLGVLLCFDEKDGTLLWKMVLPKANRIRFFDADGTGIASPPTIVGDRAFLLTNRNEVICLDVKGQADGNDGVFQDESRWLAEPKMAKDDAPQLTPKPLSATDVDVLWMLDMTTELNVRQHDAQSASVVIHDGLLYLNTANGTDTNHMEIENPDAPSLLVLDMDTGRPLARDDNWVEGTGHGQWSSPTLGIVDGETYVFFAGGDAKLHCFKTFRKSELIAEVEKTGQLHRITPLWFFNGQPWAMGTIENTNTIPIPVPVPYQSGRNSPSYTCSAPPVFDEGKIYLVVGPDNWVGPRPRLAQIVCLDVADELRKYKMADDSWAKTTSSEKSRDVTRTIKRWITPVIPDGVVAPPTVSAGLVYVADRRGNLHCYDSETGNLCWTKELRGDIWGSPFVADGKIYVGTDRRRLFVLEQGTRTDTLAGKPPEILSEIPLPDSIFTPVVAANGSLFIVTGGALFVVE